MSDFHCTIIVAKRIASYDIIAQSVKFILNFVNCVFGLLLANKFYSKNDCRTVTSKRPLNKLEANTKLKSHKA